MICVVGCVHGLWVPLAGRGVRVPEPGAAGGCEPPKQVLGIKARLSGRAASLYWAPSALLGAGGDVKPALIHFAHIVPCPGSGPVTS